MAWIYLRLIIQDLGLRFRHRMDIYTGDWNTVACRQYKNLYKLCFCLHYIPYMLRVLTLEEVVQSMNVVYPCPGSSLVVHALIIGILFLTMILASDRAAVAFSCGFIQMLISITVSLGLLVLLFKFGAEVNGAYEDHK